MQWMIVFVGSVLGIQIWPIIYKQVLRCRIRASFVFRVRPCLARNTTFKEEEDVVASPAAAL